MVIEEEQSLDPAVDRIARRWYTTVNLPGQAAAGTLEETDSS